MIELPTIEGMEIIEEEKQDSIAHYIVVKFPDNHGARIVKHSFSYGIELDIIKFNYQGDWILTRSTPIADTVVRFLNEKALENILYKIKELPYVN